MTGGVRSLLLIVVSHLRTRLVVSLLRPLLLIVVLLRPGRSTGRIIALPLVLAVWTRRFVSVGRLRRLWGASIGRRRVGLASHVGVLLRQSDEARLVGGSNSALAMDDDGEMRRTVAREVPIKRRPQSKLSMCHRMGWRHPLPQSGGRPPRDYVEAWAQQVTAAPPLALGCVAVAPSARTLG